MRIPSLDRRFPLLLGMLLVFSFSLPSVATPVIQSLTPSLPSPQPVGTLITWTTVASDPDPGTLMYAFNFGLQSSTLPLVRDYTYLNSFPAYPALAEGIYEVQVTVRNNSTLKTATMTQSFSATAIAGGSNPDVVISTTANPLVALFSAAGCPQGDEMLVNFESAVAPAQQTSLHSCGATTTNIYIAGMQASTQYSMTGIFVQGGRQVGQTQTKTFVTGAIPSTVQIPMISVISPAPAIAASEPILVHAYLFGPFVCTGTDLSGNVLWYYEPYDGEKGTMTRPLTGGYFWYIGTPNSDPYLQPLREIDVAGNTLVETNVGRINEQLTAIGQETLTDVDHELRSLPNGNILAIGSLDRILGPNIQNGADILFDELIVLNSGLQLVWSWNATTCGNCATELPPTRAAILGETCVQGQGGCPPLTPPNTIANDWLHGNSAQVAPDGSILMSLRHQDWVLKIDYNNGTGTGNILWRLGLDGDFTIVPDPNDNYPWFSHQHDVEWQFNIPYIALFDNGNTRIRQNPTQNSRGQLLKINQNTLTATLEENLDTGVQSLALGTGQMLINHAGTVIGLHYEAGFVNQATSSTLSYYEGGMFNMQSASTTYRSFQMHNLYTPDVAP